MPRLLIYCSLMLLLMTGCSQSNPTDTSPSNPGNSNSSSAGRPLAKGDFSTPKAAVETFITAGTSRDADLLSQCFDADSPGEFRKLREKTASQKELDELATFVKGAQVGDVKEIGERAIVAVKFTERKEEITMKKSASGWKILDF